MTQALSWVVGSGGLLGSNVEHALARTGPVWRPTKPIAWATSQAASQLEMAVGRFAAVVGDRPWQVAWCAGSGVVATSGGELAEESAVFDTFLASVSDYLPRRSRGSVFLASSAGGLYAGSSGPPFTENTPVCPISPYGDVKLGLETAATRWAAAYPWPVVIGRIANLYGAGQNMSKPQGLISHICRAQLLRQSISIYVPLDTLRDYIYAPDCGNLVADVFAKLRAETAPRPVRVKILASQRGVTVGAVLGELRRVFKQSINVVHRTSPTASYQARDLRLRSVVWPELDRRTMTPLPAGIRATVGHLSRQLQAGLL